MVGAHPGGLVKKEVKKEIKKVAERLLAQLEYVCFFFNLLIEQNNTFCIEYHFPRLNSSAKEIK